MLMKESEIKWIVEAKRSFDDINKALIKELVLVSPDFSKYFMIFSFASEHTTTRVLLQKNKQNLENPIALFNRALRDSELKYNIMERFRALNLGKNYKLHQR